MTGIYGVDNLPGGARNFMGSDCTGGQPGIVGLGLVGRAVAERLKGFGMNLVYSDEISLPPDEEEQLGLTKVTFSGLLDSSDIVIPLLPLTDRTFHLFDRNALAMMKKGSYLVNACSGSVVDGNGRCRIS